MAVRKSTLIVAFLSTLLLSSALAFPTGEPIEELAKRSALGKGHDNPKPLDLDITEWSDIAEENCFAMLCRYHGERIWQRAVAANANDRHRRENGADYQPFAADQLASRQTEQINPQTTSAEEFPWASMELGGEHNGDMAGLMPATINEQGPQGRQFSSHYQTQNVNRGEWFRITFNPANHRGRYCQALHQNPPDTSVCDQDPAQTMFGTPNVRLRNLLFVLVKVGKPFHFNRYNPGKKGGRSIEVEGVEAALEVERGE